MITHLRADDGLDQWLYNCRDYGGVETWSLTGWKAKIVRF